MVFVDDGRGGLSGIIRFLCSFLIGIGGSSSSSSSSCGMLGSIVIAGLIGSSLLIHACSFCCNGPDDLVPSSILDRVHGSIRDVLSFSPAPGRFADVKESDDLVSLSVGGESDDLVPSLAIARVHGLVRDVPASSPTPCRVPVKDGFDVLVSVPEPPGSSDDADFSDPSSDVTYIFRFFLVPYS